MADKVLYIGVTNTEYEKIKGDAKNAMMTIPTYCKSKIIDTEFNIYYKLILEKIDELPSKFEFSIRQLLEGDENNWENISRGVKLALGRQFYSQVDSKYIKTVNKKGYGKNGTMFYIKK
jgi:hypothetical protein